MAVAMTNPTRTDAQPRPGNILQVMENAHVAHMEHVAQIQEMVQSAQALHMAQMEQIVNLVNIVLELDSDDGEADILAEIPQKCIVNRAVAAPETLQKLYSYSMDAATETPQKLVAAREEAAAPMHFVTKDAAVDAAVKEANRPSVKTYSSAKKDRCSDTAARRIQKAYYSVDYFRQRRLLGGASTFGNEDLDGAFNLAVQLAAKDGSAEARLMDMKYWIEAADSRHRYGHRLVPYYRDWLASGTCDGFFHWLDEGGGRDLDLYESPRSKLEMSTVEYLDEKGREAHEAYFKKQKGGTILLHWRTSGRLVDTGVRRCFCLHSLGLPEDFIFVIDFDHRLFVHRKQPGKFHHSSFLSGRPALAAGCIVVRRGKLLVVNGNSGHYKPTLGMLRRAFAFYEYRYGIDRGSYQIIGRY